MFRIIYALSLAVALLGSASGVAAVQDAPPKEPPKQDPKQDPKAPPPAPKPPPATDEEAEAALTVFKKAMTSDLVSAQMAAVREVAKVRHERIIRAIVPYLRSPHQDVATSTALQLVELDHPLSADSLVAAIAPNDKRPVVLGAIFNSLGKLGYESAAAPLVTLLDKSNEDGWKKVLEEGIDAIGHIGSAKAVDPILDWRRKTASGGWGGGRRGPGGGGPGGGGKLWAATDRALKSITGGDEETTADWEKWWKINRVDLQAAATVTYRCKISWERFDGTVGKRAPCPHAPDKGHTSCTQVIRVRLVPEPSSGGGGFGSEGGGGGRP